MSKLSDKFKDFSKPVKIEELKQPKSIAIKKVPEEVFSIDLDNLPGYKEWYEASETKRFYYFTKLGKVHRGSKEVMFKDLAKVQDQLKIVKIIGSNIKDHRPLTFKREVLPDLMKALAKRKAKIEDQE